MNGKQVYFRLHMKVIFLAAVCVSMLSSCDYIEVALVCKGSGTVWYEGEHEQNDDVAFNVLLRRLQGWAEINGQVTGAGFYSKNSSDISNVNSKILYESEEEYIFNHNRRLKHRPESIYFWQLVLNRRTLSFTVTVETARINQQTDLRELIGFSEYSGGCRKQSKQI